jgi:hypothetical protein
MVANASARCWAVKARWRVGYRVTHQRNDSASSLIPAKAMLEVKTADIELAMMDKVSLAKGALKRRRVAFAESCQTPFTLSTTPPLHVASMSHGGFRTTWKPLEMLVSMSHNLVQHEASDSD